MKRTAQQPALSEVERDRIAFLKYPRRQQRLRHHRRLHPQHNPLPLTIHLNPTKAGIRNVLVFVLDASPGDGGTPANTYTQTGWYLLTSQT